MRLLPTLVLLCLGSVPASAQMTPEDCGRLARSGAEVAASLEALSVRLLDMKATLSTVKPAGAFAAPLNRIDGARSKLTEGMLAYGDALEAMAGPLKECRARSPR